MDSVQKTMMEWAQVYPEGNTLPMSIIQRLQRLTKRIELRMNAFYQQVNLSAGEFELLMALRAAGAPYCLLPSDLQIKLLLSSGAVTHRLDRLEQKGLLTRQMSRHDKRNVEVWLTDTGLRRIEQLFPQYCDLQQSIMSGIAEMEQDQLSHQLEQWLLHYEQHYSLSKLIGYTEES